jgi:hypothetical protein
MLMTSAPLRLQLRAVLREVAGRSVVRVEQRIIWKIWQEVSSRATIVTISKA